MGSGGAQEAACYFQKCRVKQYIRINSSEKWALGVTQGLALSLCSWALHLLPSSQTCPQLGWVGLLSDSHWHPAEQQQSWLLGSWIPSPHRPALHPGWREGQIFSKQTAQDLGKTHFHTFPACTQPGSSSLSSTVSFLIILIMQEDNYFSAAALALVCDSYPAVSPEGALQQQKECQFIPSPP